MTLSHLEHAWTAFFFIQLFLPAIQESPFDVSCDSSYNKKLFCTFVSIEILLSLKLKLNLKIPLNHDRKTIVVKYMIHEISPNLWVSYSRLQHDYSHLIRGKHQDLLETLNNVQTWQPTLLIHEINLLREIMLTVPYEIYYCIILSKTV